MSQLKKRAAQYQFNISSSSCQSRSSTFGARWASWRRTCGRVGGFSFVDIARPFCASDPEIPKRRNIGWTWNQAAEFNLLLWPGFVSFVSYTHGRLKGGGLSPLDLKISAKKGCFLDSSGKNKFNHFWLHLEKFWKNSLVAPPGKNPSNAHGYTRCSYYVNACCVRT